MSSLAVESDRNLRMVGIGEVQWTRRAKRQNPTNHFRLDKLNCHRILLLVTTHCCLFPAPANPHIEHHSNSIAFLNCSFEPPGSLFRVQSDDFSGIGAIHWTCAGMRVTAPRSKKSARRIGAIFLITHTNVFPILSSNCLLCAIPALIIEDGRPDACVGPDRIA